MGEREMPVLIWYDGREIHFAGDIWLLLDEWVGKEVKVSYPVTSNKGNTE
jgi:hypothetical protein